MNGSYIKVEQLLFGYSNGHHLLESSILLAERTKKYLEILSDLSGPDVQSGFTEYITGYPLENENYYALCKTWYAPEMKRPGCVWTHMLLFKYEDLNKIKKCKDVLDLFVRPSIDTDKSIYSEQINIQYYNTSNINLNISMDKLRFIEWSMYTNNKPIIIPSYKSDDYLYEIYMFWINQDDFLIRTFSFCTGALANRTIEKKIIDLQIAPYSLLRSMARQNKQLKVLDILPEKVEYPLWIDYMLNENRPDIMKEFNMLQSCLGNKYFTKKYFGKFASLYIETGAIDGEAKLSEFLKFISDIFLDENSVIIQNIILQQLLKGEHLQWFNYNSVIDVLLDLSIKLDLDDLYIKNISSSEIIEFLWMNYPNKVKYVFEKLINNKINLLGEQLIKGFALKALPEQLPELTNMDLGLCNLMVKLDSKFALCSEIWNQSRDFQLEIVNCIEFDHKNVLLEKQILINIMENTFFDLCDSAYIKFGDMAITTFLDWYCTTQEHNDEKLRWMKICKKNPNKCLRWLIELGKLEDINLIVMIINILDPYSDEVIRVDKSFWIDIFYSIEISDLSDDYKLILAQFFLPIILLKKEVFSYDIVNFSFGIIYNKIAEQKFDYQSWEKLETLLPEVAWYNSWDKCKRLHKAMKQKGYRI
ncbi:hypothetical protein FDG50_07720 [Clostridium botulinum]|uniref:GAP1-N1 domain-containing protein n=1 Tax=Clostridium botulinum TaxID=1491 RepID=UPI0014013B3A|nr:hypothetical protein [Clostridium botulinum]MBY6838315.1 hypothetical protein [Clostridium botulinum]NFG65004.1 hypothetical protein [Clostridium botulinum]NFQ24006.1 hypothetical protein [Clostridium botulinum]